MHTGSWRVAVCSSFLVLVISCGGPPVGPESTGTASEIAAVGGPAVAPPSVPARLVAPISGSLTGSRRPELRWVGPPLALVEICADRACTRPRQVMVGVDNRARPIVPLETGVAFWRVRPLADPRASFTPAWELFVPPGGGAPIATRGVRTDLDADGFVDGAVREQEDDVPRDVLHVYRGGAGGLQPTTDTPLTLDTSHFGTPVVGVGDVNGDGFGDLAVADGRGVVIYAGSAAGLVPTPLTVIPAPSGIQAFDFGNGLAAGGDVNGDGYADLFVDDGEFHVWLFLGSASGPATTPAWTFDQTGTGRLTRLLTAADLDGDGFSDLVVDDFGPGGTPQAFRVFHGAATGLESPLAGTLVVRPALPFGSAGDVNGDGIADLVTVEGPSFALFPGGPGFPPAAPTEVVPLAAQPGPIQIGDFNGDGQFDVAATTSTPTSSFFFTDDQIDVYPGNPAGISATSTLTISELSVLPNDQLNFGESLASGDYGQIGHEDLLVGASAPFPTPFFDGSTGEAFVFPGSASGLQATPETSIQGGPGFGLRVTSGAPQWRE